MSTDAQLRDQAVLALAAELVALEQTTRGLKGYTPTPVSQWAKALSARQRALALLAQIGVAPDPPAVVVAPPVGPLAIHDGTQTESSYEFLYQPAALAGGDIGGLDLRNYLGYGLGIMSWNPQGTNTVPFTIHDGAVSGVSAIPPRSGNGTSEAGLWIAQLAELARWVFGPGNAWMDLWTGGLGQGGHFHDLLFQHPEFVASYHEHTTANLLMEIFKILQGGSGQKNPINVEWTYGGVGSSKITWRAFEIYCPAGATGIFLDAGTWGCEIADPSPTAPLCVFTGPGDAIGLPNNLAGPTQNVVHLPNISFRNAGKQVYYHDNAIGVAGRLAQPARALHPHTVRMSRPLSERFLAGSA